MKQFTILFLALLCFACKDTSSAKVDKNNTATATHKTGVEASPSGDGVLEPTVESDEARAKELSIKRKQEAENSMKNTPKLEGLFIEKGSEERGVGSIVVTYESAAMYAGATDYSFKKADGSTFLIRQPHPPHKNAKIMRLFLETNPVEGPPGANKNVVGKKFKVNFKGKDVTKIGFTK